MRGETAAEDLAYKCAQSKTRRSVQLSDAREVQASLFLNDRSHRTAASQQGCFRNRKELMIKKPGKARGGGNQSTKVAFPSFQ